MPLKKAEQATELALGVIGLGHWGPNVIRNMTTHPRVKLKWVCDSDPDTFSRVSSLPLGDCRFSPDYREVLQDPSVDAVAIVTPTSTHYKLTKEALLAGKHVLCEKPLTTITEQSEELCRLARERDRKLMVGFTFLFNTGIRKLKEICDSGELGKLYYMTASRSHMGLVREDVDVTWDLAPHDISIFNYILDAVPLEVAATGARILDSANYDVAFITLYYPGEITGHIYLSWVDSNKERLIRIIGEKARADFDDINNLEPIRIFKKGIAVNNGVEADFGKFRYLLRDGDIISPKLSMSEPLAQMIDSFVSDVIEDKAIFSDGEFALQITKTLVAAQKSLATGGQKQPI